MIVAIAMKTGKVYATGNYRNEVLRKLQQEYPNHINMYPETLLLRKVKDDEMSILQPPTQPDSRISRTLETV